jgi:hypothetical protein
MGRGGKWDKTRNEITLGGKMDAELFRGNMAGVPFVLVEDKSPAPVKVFGFLVSWHHYNCG